MGLLIETWGRSGEPLEPQRGERVGKGKEPSLCRRFCRPLDNRFVMGLCLEPTQPEGAVGMDEANHVDQIAGAEAATDRQLDRRGQPSSLPGMFQPLDRDWWVATIDPPTATAETDQDLPEGSPFCAQHDSRSTSPPSAGPFPTDGGKEGGVRCWAAD